MDLAFLRSVGTISDGRGAAAERYLVSHGIAHHLQRLLGITEGVERQRERVPRAEWERLVLREELQAEFLAGSLLAAFDREMGPVELGGGWEFVVEEVRDEVARQGDRSYRERFHVGDLAQRVRWLARGLLSQDLGAESPFEVPFESL